MFHFIELFHKAVPYLFKAIVTIFVSSYDFFLFLRVLLFMDVSFFSLLLFYGGFFFNLWKDINYSWGFLKSCILIPVSSLFPLSPCLLLLFYIWRPSGILHWALEIWLSVNIQNDATKTDWKIYVHRLGLSNGGLHHRVFVQMSPSKQGFPYHPIKKFHWHSLYLFFVMFFSIAFIT